MDEGDSLYNLANAYRIELGEAEFNRLSQFIYNTAGIKMPPVKRIMLQSRLQKRLRALGMVSFKDYTDYVLSEEGQRKELISMLDVVSTNKTDFFREPVHFDFLRDTICPQFYERHSVSPLKVWSAGCSSGEEPYTIAIVLSEYLSHSAIRGDFSILGTDISSTILNQALNAVYKEERVSEIPIDLVHRYFLRSKDRDNPTVRVIQDLRKHVRFQRLNFMESNYPVPDMFDVIFCRNVLIYFDRKTQEEVIRKACMKLKQGGYFFLGHSESIMSMDLPLKSLRPTIFERL